MTIPGGDAVSMSAGRCIYWVGSDSSGHACRADTDGSYCTKHYEIEKARAVKAIEKQRAHAVRVEATWLARNLPRLPQMRVQLERAEAEHARRTTSPTNDRAAAGGTMHGSIVRAQARHLSDMNVARVVELQRIIASLRTDIARAEKHLQAPVHVDPG